MSNPLLVRGARQLLTLRGPAGPRRGPELRDLSIIENGAMLVVDGRIHSIGPARRIENLAEARRAVEIDAAGSVVMPGFVDSHTHLVHGPPRLADYEARLEGRSYHDIARDGGGIASTIRAVRQSTPRRLRAQAVKDLRRFALSGTTTLEAKSGYALTLNGELKILRLLQQLDGLPLDIVPTFLGAHIKPPDFIGDSYAFIDTLIRDFLPEVARTRLARFADVYCDQGAFSYPEALRYLEAARRLGLPARIHAAQFTDLGAVPLALETNARSLDHLEALEPKSIPALARSEVIATLLPGSVLHLGLTRYAPARALIDAGAAVALASDYNPGTSPLWNMQTVISLACSQMRMTPAEAICAATINGAWSLGVQACAGSLEAGKPADFLVLSVSDYREIPYYIGANHVLRVFKRGVPIDAESEKESSLS
ncbi:MAG: imidazolonepropionase [Acidobacteria bacterium]|nr:imidazolonepropionase [Acidobacteriota bacterium]